ncbi:hypothetical protein [Dolichospermum phage Dfl-JY45]
MNGVSQEFKISRGFEFDFSAVGDAPSAAERARAQLQEARVVLETALAAVLEAHPAAIDAGFANDCAGMVLKYRRFARERVEKGSD